MHHARCIRRRKCVAFAHKQRGKQSTVASQVKNSQADGAPRSLLNNACKQLLHTQEQGSGTPLRKETTLRNNECNKSNFAMPYLELAYRTRNAMQAGHQAGHYWQCKLLHRMPTTNKSDQTVKLGSQADKQPTPQMELQTRRTSLCANHQPDSTTFKNVTVTKTAIKQASAFNETSAKPMTFIRAASKQGSPIIKEGMAIKNIIKLGSKSNQEIMAHNPWLASNMPSSETNKHVNYSINFHTRKQ